MGFPNFLIIGANKGGTTSLHYYLKQHPQVFMSNVKEPTFFAFEGAAIDRSSPIAQITRRDVVTSLDEYLRLFDDVSGELAVGEASTGYLSHPRAAERIKWYVPDMKLIAILRNPVERAYSEYLMHVRWGLERNPSKIQFWQNSEYGEGFIRRGYYHAHLSRFLNYFERDQIKVYLYEDLRGNLPFILQDMFEFIGVDINFKPNTQQKLNTSQMIPRNLILDKLLLTGTRLLNVRSIAIPPVARKKMDEMVVGINELRRSNMIKPEIPQRARRELIKIYMNDMLKLQDLIHRDLSGWLT